MNKKDPVHPICRSILRGGRKRISILNIDFRENSRVKDLQLKIFNSCEYFILFFVSRIKIDKIRVIYRYIILPILSSRNDGRK